MIAKNHKAHEKLLQKTRVANAKPGSGMLSQFQWTVTAQKLRLTNREREVCQELFEGNTRNEIAEHLGIKPRTVRHYMEHIHQKLAVSNRVGVVLRIIQLRDQIASEPGEPGESSGQSVTQTVTQAGKSPVGQALPSSNRNDSDATRQF